MEHRDGGQQGGGDRQDADRGGAQVEQEAREDQHDEHAAEDQRVAEVFDRQFDEGRRAEDRWVDLDLRQRRRDCGERRLDAAGDLQGVAPRLLLDDEQEPRAVVDDGVGFASVQRVGSHYGLSGMASRAAKLGARLSIDSAPACGTMLVLEVAAPPGSPSQCGVPPRL